MSSSRLKQKISGSKTSSSSSSQFPTLWSEWEWNIDTARWRRYRLIAVGEYEIDYDDPLASEKDNVAASSTPTSHGFGTSAESSTATTSGDQIGTSKLRGSCSIDPLPQLSYYQADLGPTVPTPTPTHIRTGKPNTDREESKPHYKFHQPWEFKWGRVFKILWAEPKGDTEDGTGGSDSDASYIVSRNADGETEFRKVRRFIVINPQRGLCICLPINTYNRQGVTKKGVIAEHHAIIYSDKKAVYLEGEKAKGLIKTPIKVSCSSRHRLSERSRLNYAKTYSMEYNVKVCFIGKVDQKSEWQLSADYNATHPPLKFNRAPLTYEEDEDATEDKNISSMPGESSYVLESGSVTDYSLPKPPRVLDNIQEDASEGYTLGTASDYDLASSLEDNDDSEVGLSEPSFRDSRATWTTLTSESTVPSTRATIPEPRATFSNPEVDSPAVPLLLAAVEDPVYGTRNSLLPTLAQCQSLTDNQCRKIQDIVDPRGIRVYADWETPHQCDLIRLYMMMRSFPQIQSIMRGKLDYSYKTYNNRFRCWLFPTTSVEREQKIIELYALVSNQDSLAPFPETPPRMESKTLGSLNRSRSSSLSSHRSLNSTIADSIFSASRFSDLSAASSLAASQYGGSDRLVILLLGDTVLHSLIREIFRNFGPEKFVLKLRSCLLKFSKHIILEAAPARSFNMIQAGKALRYLARPAAISIKEKLEEEVSNIIDPLHHDGKSITDTQTANNRGLTEGEVDVTASEESGGDEEDEISKGGEGHQGNEGDDEFLEQDMPPTLEDDLSKSSAYQLLRENLQLHVEPDNVRKSLFEIWPVLQDRSTALRIDYDIEWEIPSFLEKSFHAGTKLGNLMTLSGSSVNAQAQSCEDYLAEKWPDIGPLILGVLEDFLRDGMLVENKNDLAQIEVRNGWNSRSTARLGISATAAHPIHEQLLTALTWLCSAIRFSTHPGVSYSSTSIKITKSRRATPSLSLRMGHLEPIPNEESCWHTLFPYGVLAEGFPISRRREGIGLEISFANMALASRCLSFVEYDNGLIAHGLTSILIPMTELEKDDALQWHFEGKTKQRGHKLAKVSQILRIHSIRKWHRELAPDCLINRRCFLGWVDRAVVTIGTKDYEPIFAWSGALRSAPISTSRSYNFTFGTSGLGFATAEGSCTKIRTAMQTSISSGIRNDVHYALTAGDENYVLLFDTAAKTGYYLPQACVVLQMIHSGISARNYELYDRDRLVTPDNVSHFANVGPDGAYEAQRALKEYFKLMIVKGETADGPVKECAIDLIGKLWHTIDDIGVKLDSLEAQFEKAGVIAPKYIHGVEWKDAADMVPSKAIKRMKVNQPWSLLSIEHPVVLFSQNIRPPIVPACKELCKSWTTVPQGQNYMAAMGTTVSSFLHKQNDGLAERLDWLNEQELISSHEVGKTRSVQHAQKLSLTKKPFSNTALRRLVQSHLHGCFVFGDGSEKKCSSTVHRTTSPSPVPEPDDTADEQLAQSLHTIPSECSDTSMSQGDSLSEGSNGPSVDSRAVSPSTSSLSPGLPSSTRCTPIIVRPDAPPAKLRTGPVKLEEASLSSPKTVGSSANRSTGQKPPSLHTAHSNDVIELRETCGDGEMEVQRSESSSPERPQKFSVRSALAKSFLSRSQSDPRWKGKGRETHTS